MYTEPFSPVSSINSCQTDKALPVKTSKPSFLSFFVYFGNSLFDYLWNFLFVAATNRKAIFLLNYASWASLARKNWRWIGERTNRDWAANQSARKTLSTVLVYTKKKNKRNYGQLFTKDPNFIFSRGSCPRFPYNVHAFALFFTLQFAKRFSTK